MSPLPGLINSLDIFDDYIDRSNVIVERLIKCGGRIFYHFNICIDLHGNQVGCIKLDIECSVLIGWMRYMYSAGGVIDRK